MPPGDQRKPGPARHRILCRASGGTALKDTLVYRIERWDYSSAGCFSLTTRACTCEGLLQRASVELSEPVARHSARRVSERKSARLPALSLADEAKFTEPASPDSRRQPFTLSSDVSARASDESVVRELTTAAGGEPATMDVMLRAWRFVAGSIGQITFASQPRL